MMLKLSEPLIATSLFILGQNTLCISTLDHNILVLGQDDWSWQQLLVIVNIWENMYHTFIFQIHV